jgi:hypothetical protein
LTSKPASSGFTQRWIRPTPTSALAVASASSIWSDEPAQLSSSTSSPFFSKKPRSSATGTGARQKPAWLQAKVSLRGCERATVASRAPEPTMAAAAPACSTLRREGGK